MKDCRIYVVRHGKSVHNRDNIVSGHVDPELTAEGRAQAQATKERLKHVHFDEVYSSDLQRAVETASIIFGKPVPKDHQLEALRERNFGELDGGPNADLHALLEKNQAEFEALDAEGRWRYSHRPGIESDHQLATRFVGALALIAQANPGKTVLVGAHGGTARITLVDLGYASQAELPTGKSAFENGGYAELIYADGSFSVGDVFGVHKHPVSNK